MSSRKFIHAISRDTIIFELIFQMIYLFTTLPEFQEQTCQGGEEKPCRYILYWCTLKKNLVDDRPDIVGQGLKYLDEWHTKMMLTSSSDVDPMWTVIKEGGPEHTRRDLKSYIKRLKKTGREHLIKKILDKNENYLS